MIQKMILDHYSFFIFFVSLFFKTIITLILIILNDFYLTIVDNVSFLTLNIISIGNSAIFHIIIHYHPIII